MRNTVKYHFLQQVFRLFSFLADKSGGAAFFVRPKVVIGTIIVGVSFTACQKKETKKIEEHKQNDSLNRHSSCYETIIKHTAKSETDINRSKRGKKMVTFLPPRVSCYDMEVPPEPSTNDSIKIVPNDSPIIDSTRKITLPDETEEK
jgi:hypothetical protein